MPFIDSGGWIDLAMAAPKGPSLAKVLDVDVEEIFEEECFEFEVIE